MKKIFFAIYIIGLIILFSFFTPISYYSYYNRFDVLYTHIFSDKGSILAGQLIAYVFIWSLFIFLIYKGLTLLKKKSS